MTSRIQSYFQSNQHALISRFLLGVLLLGSIAILPACRPALTDLHAGEIHTFAVSPTGEYLAVGGTQGVYTYRFSDLQLLWARRTSEAVESLTFKPDGTQLMGRLADEADTILLWRIQDGWQLRKWKLSFSATETTPLNWSPDGKNILLERDAVNFLLFDVAANQQYTLMREGDPVFLPGPGILFWYSAWSPNGSLLAFAVYDKGGTIELWDVINNILVYVLSWEKSSFVEGVVFDTTGTRLAAISGRKKGIIWEIETSTVLLELESPPASYIDREDRQYYPERNGGELVWSPDDKWLATGTRSGVIVIWDAATGKIARFLTGHTAPVLALSFHPDSGTLLSASQNEIIEWDVVTGEPRPTLQHLVTTP